MVTKKIPFKYLSGSKYEENNFFKICFKGLKKPYTLSDYKNGDGTSIRDPINIKEFFRIDQIKKKYSISDLKSLEYTFNDAKEYYSEKKLEHYYITDSNLKEVIKTYSQSIKN